MELYTAGTGNGQRAAIAVNECGVPCKIHVLNLGEGDQKAEWEKLARTIYPKIRGGMVPAEMFEKVLSLLEQYRSQNKSAK